jgi:GR25 family glycosyltransferase involved in LPS biosynthesis
MQAYCINLERNPERRENVQGEFEREGLDVAFFRATDGKAEAPEGLFITKSEWGCADSHIRVWRDMVEKGHEMALVFEDDIQLVPNFNSKLQEVMGELPEDWDFVNLDPNDIYRIDYKQFSDHLMSGQALNASAYIISHKCAKQLALWDSNNLKIQFDSLLAQYPIRSFHVRESLGRQNSEQASQIGWPLNRTMDWQVFMNRWAILIAFIIFLILVRRVIFE